MTLKEMIMNIDLTREPSDENITALAKAFNEAPSAEAFEAVLAFTERGDSREAKDALFEINKRLAKHEDFNTAIRSATAWRDARNPPRSITPITHLIARNANVGTFDLRDGKAEILRTMLVASGLCDYTKEGDVIVNDDPDLCKEWAIKLRKLEVDTANIALRDAWCDFLETCGGYTDAS